MTIEELAKQIQTFNEKLDEEREIRKKLESEISILQEDVKARKLEILNLEKQLAENIDTKQLQAENIEVTNINATGIIRGASLPPNLVRNSYMNLLDGSKPSGYNVFGNVALEAVHPFTKGFEGPYVQEQPSNAVSSVEEATEANPFWFGQYNKGSRASRGGLADGWHSIGDGKILKITGDNLGEHTCILFPFEQNVLTNKLRFKGWLKITSGKQVGFGVDSGYHQNQVRGFIVTKEQVDSSPDGWYQIDTVVEISEVTSLDNLAFSMGVEADASGKFEVYLALPYVTNLDSDTWLPSVSDMLSRNGLTVYPGTNNVGIGVTLPLNSLHIARPSHLNAIFDRTDTSDHLTVVVGSGGSGLRFGDSNIFFIGTQAYGERNDNSVGRELFRINPDGNTGIGTNTPQERLHISGSIRGDQAGALRISTGNGYVDVGPMNSEWSHFQTDRPRYYFDKEIRVDSGNIGSYDEDLNLTTVGSVQVTVKQGTGNVGIGTTNPRQKLEVAGNVAVQGEIQGKLSYSKEFVLDIPNNGTLSALKMLPSDKCFAFITSVAGNFEGGGEHVWVEIRPDGFWYLCGKAQQGGVQVKARCAGMT